MSSRSIQIFAVFMAMLASTLNKRSVRRLLVVFSLTAAVWNYLSLLQWTQTPRAANGDADAISFFVRALFEQKRSLEHQSPELEAASLEKRQGYDFRNCTSPESNVPWPMSGTVRSRTMDSTLTCGLPNEEDSNNNEWSQFLREHTLPQLERFETECSRLVVYGVAFGADHVGKLVNTDRLDTDALLQLHGHCFFMFCLEEDMPENSLAGHYRLIPIPRAVMPYRNLRRNAKLFKYIGHFLFPFVTDRIVWQDAKFFERAYIRQQPSDYFAVSRNADACLTVMALPVHVNSFGEQTLHQGSNYRPRYAHHCETILDSLRKRPNVTDSADNLMQQCSSYLNYMEHQGEEAFSSSDSVSIPFTLDHGLLDSAFLIWNRASEDCRTWNAELQCTVSDQLHCHSDRDQVGFPFAFAQMGLRVVKRESEIDQRRHDVQLVAPKSNSGVLNSGYIRVHMTKSACHWYFRSLDNCEGADRPSVAILVGGTAQRFIFASSVDHLLRPLKAQNYEVDYYAMLTQQQAPAFRKDAGYMQHIVGDPIFKLGKKGPDATKRVMTEVMTEAIGNAGASLRALQIRQYPLSLYASEELGAKRRAARQRHKKEDADLRFPMFDVRAAAKKRTAIGNRNLLNLFNGLQYLWDSKVVLMENSIGKQYDYIMILRDDTLWLDDLDMDKLLNYNSTADAYVLSCDARDPPMLPQELNDHGIVIKREKAAVIGRYFSSMLSANLEACHESVRGTVGKQRGCNSEMILKWILQHENVAIQLVPQSALPFERAVAVRPKKGKVTLCLHKHCQSKEAPLFLPGDVPKCKDVAV